MNFFIPQTRAPKHAYMYDSIIASVKDQLGCKITDRKIYSLEYVHDKKSYSATVGELEQIENRFKVWAILEAKLFIVFTRHPKTHEVVTILVNSDEVTSVVDFA